MTAINVDLMGANVFFTAADGRQERATVNHIWPQMGKVPGVNVKTESEVELTSVPHTSSVPEATGFFWSLGSRSELEERL